MNGIETLKVIEVLGDINGDGFNEVLLENADSEVSREIRFPLRDLDLGEILTEEDITDSTLEIEWPGEPLDEFNESSLRILNAGDINGDGFDEIAVQTNYYDDGFSRDRLYVIFGRADSERRIVNIDTLSKSDGFLADAQSAQYNSLNYGGFADIDGDGFDDLLIGRPYTGEYYSGSVKLLFGDSEGDEFESSVIFNEYEDVMKGVTAVYFGDDLRAIGDINQDGIDDIAEKDIIFLGGSDRNRFYTSITTLIRNRSAGFTGVDQRDNLIIGTNQAARIRGLEGNDVIVGLNGNDTLIGNQGNDQLKGDRGSDLLLGRSGNDVLSGGAGNDLLKGDSGRDRLVGGAGVDSLSGGSGMDRFVFLKSSQPPDHILDFNPGDDLILLKQSGFDLELSKGGVAKARFVIGSAAQDRSDRFIYNDQTGVLLFDADGTGGERGRAIAVLSNTPELSADDIRII